MTYYIAVEKEQNSYIGLNFAKLVYHVDKAQKKEKNGYTLKELDEFTSRFESESDLKSYLSKEKIITTEIYDKPILVISVNGDEVEEIIGSPIYKDNKQMVANPMLVTEYIISKYNELDLDFFKKLYDFYGEETVAGIKIKELISKLSTIQDHSVFKDELTTVNENGDTLLSEIIKLTMLDIKHIENEKVVYSGLNYERLRSIVTFILNYIPNQEREIKPKTRKKM